MAYKILFSPLAQSSLSEILYNDDSGYTPSERLAHVEAIETHCYKLELLPKPVRPIVIKGREYGRIFFKAHTIYYQVFDDQLACPSSYQVGDHSGLSIGGSDPFV